MMRPDSRMIKIKLSRATVSVGYVIHSPSKTNDNFQAVFLNIHGRISEFNQFTKPLKIGLFFEPGVNMLLPVPVKGEVFSLPMPYFKGGPEIKINNELYASLSVGFNLFLYGRQFFPLPFNGINIFYLTNISEKNFIELESGVHTLLPFTSDLLFYINVGFSIR